MAALRGQTAVGPTAPAVVASLQPARVKPLVRRKGQFTNLPVIDTTASELRLSIASSNKRLQLRFQDARGWSDAGSAEVFAQDDYLVSLSAATIGVHQALSSTFRQLTVSGAHSYRPYVRGPLTARPDFMTGGVTESYVYGKLFGADQWGSTDMLATLNANGMHWLRTTVTMQSHATLAAIPTSQWHSLPWNGEYWQSQQATGALIEMAGKHGMSTILAFFLAIRQPIQVSRTRLPPGAACRLRKPPKRCGPIRRQSPLLTRPRDTTSPSTRLATKSNLALPISALASASRGRPTPAI